MDFSFSEEMYTRLECLADRRGWSVEELIAAYVGVAADADEAGDAALLSDEERAVLLTGLMALGLPEPWRLVEKLSERTLLWVRQS